MNINEFAEKFLLNLPFEPNDQQVATMAALSRFCSPLMGGESLFLLMGYAGTGKTSLTSALVKTLRAARIPVVLLAPTGRAAKVFSKMSGYKAFTIHRKIYKTDNAGNWSSEPAYNPVRNGIFIVDEASMIGESDSGGLNLLEDLIHYVYSGEGCRMIFLGDNAQLPPVGYSESPAFDIKKLKTFGLRVSRAVLTEVVRQSKKSGILLNATYLRKSMLLPELPEVKIKVSGFNDIEALESDDVQDSIEKSYGEQGIENTMIITRSNKRATLYNRAVRERILGREEELCRDDRLLVVKNNYLWSVGVKGLDFIANGDIGVVEKIYGTETKYGWRFANVRLRFPDLDKEVDCKIMLGTLTSDSPNLTAQETATLQEAVLNDPDNQSEFMQLNSKFRLLKTNEYLNALQVKYGYAVTCHKAQGGQWNDVYVDTGNASEITTTKDFYRWLYTAITRATEKLYLLNSCVTIV
ncbi:MAG: AAA family ATPase [Paramuribaculum sp.]|nr:AAA family ATPase [Paramuribaculum sp.]